VIESEQDLELQSDANGNAERIQLYTKGEGDADRMMAKGDNGSLDRGGSHISSEASDHISEGTIATEKEIENEIKTMLDPHKMHDIKTIPNIHKYEIKTMPDPLHAPVLQPTKIKSPSKHHQHRDAHSGDKDLPTPTQSVVKRKSNFKAPVKSSRVKVVKVGTDQKEDESVEGRAEEEPSSLYSIAFMASLLTSVVVVIILIFYNRAYLYSCLLGTRNKYLSSKSKV